MSESSETDYEVAAIKAGWKKLNAEDSELSWEKHDVPNSIQGCFKVDMVSGQALRMTAKELCLREGINV